MKQTIGLALLLVVIQEPFIGVYGGRYPESNQSTKTSPLLSRRSKVENAATVPVLAKWKTFLPPSVQKNLLFVLPLIKRLGNKEISLMGVQASKRYAKSNYTESTGQTNIKLGNSNFTGAPLLTNSSSVKTDFENYTTKLPTTTSQKALQEHSQHLNTVIANVEETVKDSKTDNETKSYDGTSSNKSNTKESALIQDYKVLGGDDDEDSARWALEEITQQFKAKAKNLKTNSGSLDESDKHGGMKWKNKLNSKEKSEAKPHLLSSKHSKHFGTSNTSTTVTDLEKNVSSTAREENQVPNSVNHNKNVREKTFNVSFTPSNNGIVSQGMFMFKKPNETLLNKTFTPISGPSISLQTPKQFPFQRNSHETDVLNRTSKTTSNTATLILETKNNSDTANAYHYKLYDKKPSLNYSSPDFPINKTNFSLAQAQSFKMDSNNKKVTMKSLASTSSPLWKPFIPPQNSSSQKFNISTNKTQNSLWNESFQTQPTGGVVQTKPITASIRNHTRPTLPNPMNDSSIEITKKPSLNLHVPNISLSNSYESKMVYSEQERAPYQPNVSKTAETVEVIDDYSTNATRNIGQHDLLTEQTKRPTPSSNNSFSAARPSVNKLDKPLLSTMNAIKNASNRLSNTPSNEITKGGTPWKVSPVNNSSSVVKQNNSFPYQPINEEIVETFVMKKTNRDLRANETFTKFSPTKSKSWWGDTPRISSKHLNPAMLTTAYSPVSKPLSFVTKYRSPVGINRYKYSRGRRTSEWLDLSSESAGEKGKEGSSSNAKPKSMGTIVINLMSRNNKVKGSKTLRDNALPLLQISDNPSNMNKQKTYLKQSAKDIKYVPHSMINFKLSHQQNPEDLHETQQNIDQAKNSSEYLPSDNGKKLELKVFHTSRSPNVEIKNGEDFHKQNFELGMHLNEENIQKNQKNNGIVMKNSEKVFESEDTHNDKQLINQHKDTTQKARKFGTEVMGLYKQQNDNYKAYGKIKAPSIQVLGKDGKRNEKPINKQGNAVAHILIHDLSGKPIFKGKVNLFLPNNSKTKTWKSGDDAQLPQINPPLNANVTGTNLFPAKMLTNSSKDILFGEKDNKLHYTGDTSINQLKNNKHYAGISLSNVKNKQNVTKVLSNKIENTASGSTNKVRQRQENKSDSKGKQMNSTTFSDLKTGRFGKYEQNTPSNVNIPLIEEQHSKEIKMNDHLMITENTKENSSPHLEREESLKDERKNVHRGNSKTQTLKGIKSLTISLQKGNESLPIIQQLDDGEFDEQSPTFQVTASASSDNSVTSQKGVNDSPSLSMTVTTDDSIHGTESNETKKGNKTIALHRLIKNGEFGDQMKGHAQNWTKTRNPYNQFNNEFNFPEQNYNLLPTTTKALKVGQQNKDNSVTLDVKFSNGFQSNMNNRNANFQLPEEQKISVVNENQKLVIPLALSQEYKQANSDQTLAGQEYPQIDVPLLKNALPGEKTDNQVPNVVTVGDPTEQRWTKCRASQSTQGGGLTILNCDKKGPSLKQALDLGMETNVPAAKSFFQGGTEPSGIDYPTTSLAVTALQPQLKDGKISQNLRQVILNDVNSELKAEGNLITKLVAESTQVKPDAHLGYNLGEGSFFTESNNPVSLPPINPSTFWDAGNKARLSINPANFQAPFVHQYQGPPHHHLLVNSRHSLPYSYRSPVITHRLSRSKHRTMGGGVPNPFLFLNSLRMPLVHHLVRPMFPHMRGRLPLNRQLLNRIGLHKRFQIKIPVDGPPGKRTQILHNRPKPTRGAGRYRLGVCRTNEGEWAYLGKVFCCCPLCT